MKIIEEITDLINTYHATEIEAHNLNYLLGMRKELSVKAFELGRKVSNFKYHQEETNAMRKTSFAKAKIKHLGERKTVSQSESMAESDIEEIRLKNAKYEGLYMGSKIVLEQVNQVLSSLQQDISILRQEANGQ